MAADPHIAYLNRKVDDRMKREDVDEVLSRSTVDDGHQNWITTVIWRTPERKAPAGIGGNDVTYVETHWMVFVNGQAQASGGADPEWGEED